MWNQKWQPGNGCDNSSMAKNVINSSEFMLLLLGFRHTNWPELLFLKRLPLNYYHSPFLAATFDFTSFFTLTYWGRTLLHSMAVFYRYHFLFICFFLCYRSDALHSNLTVLVSFCYIILISLLLPYSYCILHFELGLTRCL